jgi:mannose-1-phosphate guanylyltransferase
MKINKALLLAAGFGTRLRPLTINTPKCLVPIKGKPLLEIWLDNLSKSGVCDFLINTHYLSNQVNEFINNSKYRNQIHLVNEKILLGTAGTLMHNIDFFDKEDGLLIHADNFCLDNLNDFFLAHFNRPKECLITMLTFRTDSPSKCGIVEIDANGIVVGFHEKVPNPPGNLANGAVYILSSDFINILKMEYSDVKDFSTEVLNKFIGKIYTYNTNETFMDIGTPEMYNLANSIY